MSEDSIISLQNVNKWFGDFHVLKDVDLNVKKKERIFLILTTLEKFIWIELALVGK